MTDQSKPRPPPGPRPLTAGPDDGPEPPFPIRLSGRVIKGFGRGSKELGIPTANIPVDTLLASGNGNLPSGVYFGWVGLEYAAPSTNTTSSSSSSAAIAEDTTSPPATAPTPSSHSQKHGVGEGPPDTYPAVLSLGYNPFFSNPTRSLEVHLLSHFPADFYGARLKLTMLGFVRPEYDYASMEELVADIWADVDVAARSLARRGYAGFRKEGWLVEWGDVAEVNGGGEDGEKKGEA